MKKSEGLILAVVAGLLTACSSVSTGGGGTAEVNFQSPEKFTDMARGYPETRGADEGYLLDLKEYIERNASNRLPAGYTLAVTITDVDMAGQFEPERGPQLTDVRMVRSIYPPRINLAYRLTDAAGTVRSQGDRQLRDSSFDMKLQPFNRDDPLKYEKGLMDDFIRNIAQEAR